MAEQWHALHFNKIAKVLRGRREESYLSYPAGPRGERIQLLNELTLEFAAYFETSNPNFDADVFIAASGYKP